MNTGHTDRKMIFTVRARIPLNVDMLVGFGRGVHDKNNNYSADCKNDETACGYFFISQMLATIVASAMIMKTDKLTLDWTLFGQRLG